MTTEGTVYDQYFEWLYGLVSSVRNRNPARSHWHLLRKFYSTEFTWFVPNDDNRWAEGIDLRHEWIHTKRIEDVDNDWLELGCSVLEMLIALARRVSFESEGTPAQQFWKLVQNLELDRYTDDIYEISIAEEVEDTLDRLIRRTYGRDGTGGLFPLRRARRDQRRIELWYQMSDYLLEKYHDLYEMHE